MASAKTEKYSADTEEYSAETEEYSAEELSQSQNQSDSTFSPESESLSDFSEDDEGAAKDPIDVHLEGHKAIVFLSCLLQLIGICQVVGCGSLVDPENKKVTQHGAVIIITYTCNNHHVGEWCSSPTVGKEKSKVWVLNTVLASYCLTCGLHISQVLDYFQHLRIYVFGKTFYYNLQTGLLEKTVWTAWADCQKTEIQNLKRCQSEGIPTKLSGDGKFDSRGFSASFLTYNLMDVKSSKVIGLWVAEKHMVKSSSAMEPYAAKSLILSLAWDHNLPIQSVTTDRSTSMRTMLQEIGEELPPDYVPPTHEFDIWHWIKAVNKSLWAAAKLVSCKGLNDWIPSINNMMWHSFSSCQGDPQLLREKLLSIPGHISNQHCFPNNTKYKACPHPPLTGRTKAWLAPNSLAVKKVLTALTGPDEGRIKDVPYMTGFTHTGPIENWNSLHNKYANKNYPYSYRGMLVRGALAVLDHNSNCDRDQAVTKHGCLRFDLVKNRFGNKWFVRKVKRKKDHTWRDDISFLVLKSLETGRLPKIVLPVGSADTRVREAAPRPSKEDAIKYHQSRMVMS